MKLILSETAFKQLSKFAPDIQSRINSKLNFYLAQKDPLDFSEKLNDYEFGEWRFRIGDYRAIFDVDGDKIIILKVGHRKNIYK